MSTENYAQIGGDIFEERLEALADIDELDLRELAEGFTARYTGDFTDYDWDAVRHAYRAAHKAAMDELGRKL